MFKGGLDKLLCVGLSAAEKTFLQICLVILKRMLQNYSKILKKCYCVDHKQTTVRNLSSKSPIPKGLRNITFM